MYIKFCGRVSDNQCRITDKKGADVQKSIIEHGERYSFIKHSGKDCGNNTLNQGKPCMYAILVHLPKTMVEKISHFSLVAHHNETTHIKLREGISVENIVEHDQFRYFRFVNRDPKVTNVTFTLVSHHGDADMFVSTVDKYPDIKHFEKKSTLSSRFADEIIFSKTKKRGSLLGIYYIGVKGFEYTSYSIRASLTRKADDTNSTIVPIRLREGVSHNEFLHGKDDKKYFKFKTRMRGESISDIRITLTASTGDYKYFVKSGSFPTPTSYDYASFDSSDIIMRKDDKKFRAYGTKYILVIPNAKFGTFPNKGRFSIKYSTGQSTQPISKDIPIHGIVKIGDYDYFRYHSISKVDELTVALTPLSGESNLVVSTNSSNSYPTVQKSDYHSSKIGKDTITIHGSELFQDNPT